MTGSLFSAYFLDTGIALQPGWGGEASSAARARVAALMADFAGRAAPSEANTERDLIDPLLQLLGWSFSVQEKASRTGRGDVPDYLLFADEGAKAAAQRLPAPADRYRLGVSLVEAKAWGLGLDSAGAGSGGAPSTQLLRYLGAVGVQSNDAVRFGILTNGRVWRLYDNAARSKLEGYVEIDLFEAAGRLVPATGAAPDHADRVLARFLFLFGRDAFVPDAAGRTRLSRAIADSRSWEARVTDSLARTVFDRVFPDLANALDGDEPLRRLARKFDPAAQRAQPGVRDTGRGAGLRARARRADRGGARRPGAARALDGGGGRRRRGVLHRLRRGGRA